MSLGLPAKGYATADRPAQVGEDWDLADIVDGLTGPDHILGRACARLIDRASRMFPAAVWQYRRTIVCYAFVSRDPEISRLLKGVVDRF